MDAIFAAWQRCLAIFIQQARSGCDFNQEARSHIVLVTTTSYSAGCRLRKNSDCAAEVRIYRRLEGCAPRLARPEGGPTNGCFDLMLGCADHVAGGRAPRQAGQEGGHGRTLDVAYTVVYAGRGDAVHVVRILHGAQQWPQSTPGKWRAMPDGSDGIHGNHGNVVSVTYGTYTG